MSWGCIAIRQNSLAYLAGLKRLRIEVEAIFLAHGFVRPRPAGAAVPDIGMQTADNIRYNLPRHVRQLTHTALPFLVASQLRFAGPLLY